MNLDTLKTEAKEDMKNRDGELGFAEGQINGRTILITAKKWGVNKPGRKEHTRFIETDITK